MRIGELSAAIGVSRDAIQGWILHPELTHFFSPGALLKAGTAQRVFNESDVLILNTIRWLRYEENVTDWRDIAHRVGAGERFQEFPMNAVSVDTRTIPLPQAEQSARAMATMAERDNALARVKELEAQIEKLEASYKADLRAEQEARRADVEKFMREIAELRYTIGRLESDRGRGE